MLSSVLGVFFTFQSGIARAGDQDFTLLNRTGCQIGEVYVSRSSSRNWGGDIMGSDALENGRSVNITFNAPDSVCRWDMKVKYNDVAEVQTVPGRLVAIKQKEVTRAATE